MNQTASSGVDNREELILAHIPFIKYHAYRIIGQLPPIIDVGDLINAGVLGLMEAIERFDPSRGVKFRTFADRRIRGAMLDSLRSLTWAPKALRRQGKQLEAVRKELRREPGIEVDEGRICQEMGISLEELHELIQQLHALNIGAFALAGNGDDLTTYYPDRATEGPHYQFERQELRTVLARAVERLGRKEKLVVSLYYFEELTMKEIGLVLKVNESRVSQIHSSAMAHLRDKLKEYGSRKRDKAEKAFSNSGTDLKSGAHMEQSYSQQVLIVGHTNESADFIVHALQKENYEIQVVSSGTEAFELLRQNPFDILITEVALPDLDGIEMIQKARTLYCDIVPIVVSEDGSVSKVVAAVRNGAFDYVITPVEADDLCRTVQQALQRRHWNRVRAVSAGQTQDTCVVENMIGESTAMQKIFRLVQTIGKTNSSVLITGETGTGKELVAKAIHACSSRKNQSIVSLNCGAIPENLLESELFGHTKGAFTGAHQTRIGRFEQANKGTLFLDEIGNMSPALQVKLLRVLQEREFERVGGSEKIKVDVRIIAATSAKLSTMVKQNEFRMDLYYRLNVIPIHMPPLRERRQDIPLLAQHFVRQYCDLAGMEHKTITQEAMKVLMNCSWPGNVRQLENAIERAIALAEDPAFIVADDLPQEVQKSTNNLFLSEIYIPDEGLDFNTEVSAFERQLILESLKKTGGSRNEAAKLLQLKRTTLVEKLKRLTTTEDDYEEQFA